jgi:hypothetical protein
MFDQISRILMTISNYMDHTECLTRKLIVEVSEETINDFMNGIDNRERLIKIIGKFNTTLEQSLDKIHPQQYKVLEQVLLRYWFNDLDNWKKRMAKLDELMMGKVQIIRAQTKKEIRSTFDTKKKVSGYNLRSTK